MDLLRSCYTKSMSMWYGSSASVLVRWFFIDGDGPVFPGWHRFGSGNWASTKDDWFGPGELPGRHGWSDGSRPREFAFSSPKGELDWYRTGAPVDAEPLCTDDEGRCDACGFQNSKCYTCIGHIPARLKMTVTRVWAPPGVGALGHVGDDVGLTLQGDPTTSAWQMDQGFSIFPFPDVFPGLWCNDGKWTFGIYPTIAAATSFLSKQKPFGAMFYRVRPFMFLLPDPRGEEEWDILVGADTFLPTPWYVEVGGGPIDWVPEDMFADGT